MADRSEQPLSSMLADVAGRFVVEGEALACDHHAKAVQEFARQLEANDTPDEAVLSQVDESLRCLECRLIAAAVAGETPPSEDEDQRALESFLRSWRSSTTSAESSALPFMRRRGHLDGLWQRRAISVLASIAATVLIALGSVLAWQNHRLRQQSKGLEAQVAELQANLPRERVTVTSHLETLPPSENVPPSTFAITLPPGLSRSLVPTAESTVALTKAINSIAVSLIVEEGGEEDAYTATVEGPAGKVLYTVARLKSAPSKGAGRIVTFTVPAGALKPGGYIVRLKRSSATGAAAVINDYSLFVSPPRQTDPAPESVSLSNETGAAAAITVGDRSSLLPAGGSTMALPTGDFAATILSKCGTLTQTISVRPGTRNTLVIRCAP